MNVHKSQKRLPPWFKVRLTVHERFAAVKTLIKENNLSTVCESAACPNRMECWNAGTATFLILGPTCTRRCGFCHVPHGTPQEPDVAEAYRVAETAAALNLSYVVVTSVTRDDLDDGGAGIFAHTIKAIHAKIPGSRVEVLIPDFQGSERALRTVLDAGPDVLNHNIETVPSLYARVRPQAQYARSLELLARAKASGFVTKSGLMMGLGEDLDEIRSTMYDLRSRGCDMLTIGQYLAPDKVSLPVKRYYHPDEFSQLREQATALGFRHVEAGPLVRSSYHAAEYGDQIPTRRRGDAEQVTLLQNTNAS